MLCNDFFKWMNLLELEHKGALQTIIYLYEKGDGASINELGRELKVTVSTLRLTTLPILRKWNLVEYEVSTDSSRSHFHALTGKGLEFAKALKKIQSQ